MTRAAKKRVPRVRRRSPSQNRRLDCRLCGTREQAIGTIANTMIGPKCLGIVERIAEKAGFSLPLSEFTPFKKKP